MTFDEKIGELICAWRQACDMSQASLAEAIGASQATVSKMETGRQAPSIKQLLEILRATGKSLEEVAPEISRLDDAAPKPLWERFND